MLMCIVHTVYSMQRIVCPINMCIYCIVRSAAAAAVAAYDCLSVWQLKQSKCASISVFSSVSLAWLCHFLNLFLSFVLPFSKRLNIHLTCFVGVRARPQNNSHQIYFNNHRLLTLIELIY